MIAYFTSEHHRKHSIPMIHYVSKMIKGTLFGSHTYFTAVLKRAIPIEGSRKS